MKIKRFTREEVRWRESRLTKALFSRFFFCFLRQKRCLKHVRKKRYVFYFVSNVWAWTNYVIRFLTTFAKKIWLKLKSIFIFLLTMKINTLKYDPLNLTHLQLRSKLKKIEILNYQHHEWFIIELITNFIFETKTFIWIIIVNILFNIKKLQTI